MDNQNDLLKDEVYCLSCGNKNANNHSYCIFCGSALSLDSAGNISQIHQASVTNNQEFSNSSQQTVNEEQNNQQCNLSSNKKEYKKYGLLVWAGFFGLFSFLLSNPICLILGIISLVYYVKKDNPFILGFILRAIGVLFLGIVTLLLILLGTCIGYFM